MTMRYHTRRDQGAIIGTYVNEAAMANLHPNTGDAGQRAIVTTGPMAPKVVKWDGAAWKDEFIGPF